MTARSTWRAVPGPVRLLLFSQFAFNTGFYLVVPFLAVHLSSGLGMAGWVVGLVLGLRTFSQQGFFFVGGALTDRYGVRPVLLTGCLVRIAGFCTLAVGQSLPGVLAGTVLTGFAAALFSPAVETGFAHAGARLEEAGAVTRAELFALDDVVSKVGSLAGPVLGAALLGVPFSTTCFVAAGVFAVVLAANARWAPRADGVPRSTSVTAGWGSVLRNRRFLVFAALYSTLLLAYNQMYLALPVELVRATGSQRALGAMFVVAAVVTVLVQVPVARWARRRGAARALPAGFAVTALAFALVAAATVLPSPDLVPALAPPSGSSSCCTSGRPSPARWPATSSRPWPVSATSAPTTACWPPSVGWRCSPARPSSGRCWSRGRRPRGCCSRPSSRSPASAWRRCRAGWDRPPGGPEPAGGT